ncbi:hypothetical protein [Stygiobacter electus]|jgi:hypothetical protein|uniref:Uncharacterized protein n=1 Tax=Stygiobacter electus TaxID=3032292 RepID=A0AAE3NW66_9BACT|nr:hypothetical protein [Stygiobacter electus]MDF1612026.1 hypothetical protein [Stygiobacter electus]
MKKLSDLTKNKFHSTLHTDIPISLCNFYKYKVQNIITTKENKLKPLASIKINTITSRLINEFNNVLFIKRYNQIYK